MSNSNKQFTALHVEGEGSHQDLQDSFRLRYEVFCHEERFFAPDDYPDQREQDSFDELSEHIVVRECESERLVGTARLVRYSSELEFPTAQHFSDLYTKLADIPLDKIYEISRLCVSPLYRQRLVSEDELYCLESYLDESQNGQPNGSSNRKRYPIALILLIKKMRKISISLGVNYLIASMEAALIRYLSMCGIESVQLTNECIEFNGQVMPCIIDIDTTFARMSKKRPKLYEFFTYDDFN